MHKPIATQFTVPLSNKPGQLAELTKYLADKKVNLTGISCETLGDIGFARLTVQENEAEVKALLEAKGYRPTATKVYQLELPNQPGMLHLIARRLSEKNINILNVFGSASGPHGSILFIAVDQFEKAQPILEKELLASAK